MLNRMFPFIVPVLAFLTAITGLIGIGEFLLFVARSFESYGEAGKLIVPLVALALIAIIGILAALMARRASKLPPVQWPNPGPVEPVRRIDLGAGYIVGQFIFFFGLGLLLLFAILVLK